MSTKPGSMPVSGLPTQTAGLSISRLVSRLFPKDSGNCVTGLPNTIVSKSAWNLLENTGCLFLISWKEPSFLSFLHTPNIRNHKRVIRPTTRMPNGSAICSCVTWSSRPLSHLLTRHLRDLVRYRFKLTCMITGEKNRAQNCFTVSNLKLNDVFSDVLGKYSRFITEQLPAHPRNFSTWHLLLTAGVKHLLKRSRLLLMASFLPNRLSSSGKALTT